MFVIWSVVMETTSSACCRKPFNKHCWDCTPGTPCCGYRSCNIFCCGCDCRKEPSGKVCFERDNRCRCVNSRRKRQLSFDTTDVSAYHTFLGLDINKSVLATQISQLVVPHTHIPLKS